MQAHSDSYQIARISSIRLGMGIMARCENQARGQWTLKLLLPAVKLLTYNAHARHYQQCRAHISPPGTQWARRFPSSYSWCRPTGSGRAAARPTPPGALGQWSPQPAQRDEDATVRSTENLIWATAGRQPAPTPMKTLDPGQSRVLADRVNHPRSSDDRSPALALSWTALLFCHPGPLGQCDWVCHVTVRARVSAPWLLRAPATILPVPPWRSRRRQIDREIERRRERKRVSARRE